MGLQSKDNSLRNFKLGLYTKDLPPPLGFVFMEDDLGNQLRDADGNKLVAPE
jgi:hypothetical protein